ncbi:hypothetical protein BC937DRAFT_94691 [Endogone sp. FLAS-F59071]|nr:hypothetical protein BC937DRAFT_94691 [Endogone sp. FLAS-F59071]|eukprot:RUS20652.1 hypothetical protein BC937DRAFT_94691 [Endogone sp. FLAS-F59071]
MSLFPTPQRQKHLVEFRAGKCIREGSLVKPDIRKGLVYMDQSDDSLMHFYWKERKASTAEDDLIIFPEEAEFVRVTQCYTGRVYLLKFKSSDQKLFFWMQDKADDKDEELAVRVNRLINNPESVIAEQRGSAGAGGPGTGNTAQDVLNILGGEQGDLTGLGVDQDQLLQYLQTVGGFGGAISTSSTAPGDGPTNQPPITSVVPSQLPTSSDPSSTTPQPQGQLSPTQLSDLRNILAGIRVPESQGLSPDINLANVLTPTAIGPLLNDPQICSALFSYLPENSQRTPEELRDIIQSPQFTQALQSLSIALQSGQLGPLLTQLGLDPSAGNSVEAFLNAIQEQAGRQQSEEDQAEEGQGEDQSGDRMDED